MNAIVIFSIAGTLGALTLPGGQVSKARLEPHPAVVTLLRQLHEEKVSIGIEIPDERFEHDSVAKLLAGAGLLALVDPKLILQSPFPVVAVEGKSVFVGRDRFLRARAGKGFTTVPDPSLVSAALRGEKLSYIRARAKQQIERDTPLRERFSWLPIVEGIELAPLRVAVEEGHPVLYAAAGEGAIGRLEKRVSVERLGAPNLPERTDLVLFQTSFAGDAGKAFRKRLEALPLFLETPGGVLVALDANQPVGAFHPPDDAHGHTLALSASSTVLDPGADVAVLEAGELDATAQAKLASLDGSLLKKNLDPWLGGQPPIGACGGVIASRFLFHPDNSLAVTALGCELERILGNSTQHVFSHGGIRHNVYADLAGTGASAELVIVGAHLDSTAARSGGCSLPSDTTCVAPGADDDASGIAAVLSIASVLKQLADAVGAPERTIRFELFNAEEQGMVGSDAYAKDLAANGKTVRAMFQLDMIGTPGLGQAAAAPNASNAPAVTPPWIFEIHTGGFDDLSTAIYTIDTAQKEMENALEGAASLLSPGLTAQRFPVAPCDRDPGSSKTDHTNFQFQGFPACYVSEELWTHACPGAMRSHPTYHSKTDTQIDADYAAAIARAVAGAAWLVANP